MYKTKKKTKKTKKTNTVKRRGGGNKINRLKGFFTGKYKHTINTNKYNKYKNNELRSIKNKFKRNGNTYTAYLTNDEAVTLSAANNVSNHNLTAEELKNRRIEYV